MNAPLSMMKFDSEQDATAWMLAHLEAQDETCVDNERFAFVDDDAAMGRYHDRKAQGCCGSFDQDVVVAGRPARVGCNFGH